MKAAREFRVSSTAVNRDFARYSDRYLDPPIESFHKSRVRTIVEGVHFPSELLPARKGDAARKRAAAAGGGGGGKKAKVYTPAEVDEMTAEETELSKELASGVTGYAAWHRGKLNGAFSDDVILPVVERLRAEEEPAVAPPHRRRLREPAFFANERAGGAEAGGR